MIPRDHASSTLALSTKFGFIPSVRKRVGYFDDNDGIFFEVTDADLAVVPRTSTSGSPVETRIAQSAWNIDKLDGTGPSGVTLDPSKAQILAIDFQWLGAGVVRIGFDIDGEKIYAHSFFNANTKTSVYMKSGSLPTRYEIESVAASSGGTMKQICTSVMREGSTEERGNVSCVDNGVTAITASTTAQTVLSIRLASSHIRAFLRPLAVALTNLGNVTVRYRVILNGTLATNIFECRLRSRVQSGSDHLHRRYWNGARLRLRCFSRSLQGDPQRGGGA